MEHPFNGDSFIARRILQLRDMYHIQDAIETGTHEGNTARWLAAHFARAYTIEIDLERASKAIRRGGPPNLAYFCADSPNVLEIIAKIIHGTSLVYLDAHWNEYWPLLDELAALVRFPRPPVVVIHDFKVPEFPDLGYDSYGGRDLDMDYVRVAIDTLYQTSEYRCEFNTPTTAAGAKRGVAYFMPVIL